MRGPDSAADADMLYLQVSLTDVGVFWTRQTEKHRYLFNANMSLGQWYLDVSLHNLDRHIHITVSYDNLFITSNHQGYCDEADSAHKGSVGVCAGVSKLTSENFSSTQE